MKAVVCEAFGGPEVLALREVPDPPPPGAGEVQVRIAARGVQYVDVLMLAGKYQFRPEPPFVLEADLVNTSATDLCSMAPGSVRVGPRTVRFQSEDFREALRCLLTWTYLGASEAPRYAGT